MTAQHSNSALLRAAQQHQFLEVIERDEAEARFRQHLVLKPLGEELIALARTLGRVLSRDVVSNVDVPGFDRSRMDGFAVRAADTVGASDDAPCTLRLNSEILTPGVLPQAEGAEEAATIVATGGMIPRGADAVVMVEYTEAHERLGQVAVDIYGTVAPGANIAAAGSDIAQGETILRAGQVLTSREIGCLAAVGLAAVHVWRKPTVAIFSTGDELIAPGEPRRLGGVYDSNSVIFAAAVEEAGGTPVQLGIARDVESEITAVLEAALKYDIVLLSGGTSKGVGDLAYHAVSKLPRPGIVVHGVALKPGKPLCLAVTDGKPVVILPGFPTSAIFIFHEFVAPVIRAFAGLPQERPESVKATVAARLTSDRGRTEFVMVSLIRGADEKLVAYPANKGSGSVTTFGQSDGFFTVGSQSESVPDGAEVDVTLIGAHHKLVDLVIIGSHCVGLDLLVGRIMSEGFSVRTLSVGSNGGLTAAKRGECDIAGIHLMDPATGEYNRPFLTDDLELVPGYMRLQGIVFRPGDPRFEGRSAEEAAEAAIADSSCMMRNRNAGCGTRILIDRLLNGSQPEGYTNEAKTHNAVAVAVAQGHADWGVAIQTVARQYGLGFLPLQVEHYDFVIPKSRSQRVPVRRFVSLLSDPAVRDALRQLGFELEKITAPRSI
ncbi:MAG: molybdopterin biosynthesis protein [Candidatus Korobacteraceae bacterium]|jgi:putative molybdopterin biosynthesis protein